MAPELLAGPFRRERLWFIDFEVSTINGKKKHQTYVDFFPVSNKLERATEL
jgi:hypothetical protein